MQRGPSDRERCRLTVTIEVNDGAWEGTYGVPCTRAAVRDYVRQTLQESGAGEEGAFVGVEVR
jgi:hypothetical protein